MESIPVGVGMCNIYFTISSFSLYVIESGGSHFRDMLPIGGETIKRNRETSLDQPPSRHSATDESNT